MLRIARHKAETFCYVRGNIRIWGIVKVKYDADWSTQTKIYERYYLSELLK